MYLTFVVLNDLELSKNRNPTDIDSDKTGHECIICKAGQDESLKMFVDKTWGTLKRAAEYRLALKTDCFRDVTIEVNMQQQINNAKYHSKCYRNYTAVKRPSTDSKSHSISKTLQTRRNSSMPSSNTEGLLKGATVRINVTQCYQKMACHIRATWNVCNRAPENDRTRSSGSASDTATGVQD